MAAWNLIMTVRRLQDAGGKLDGVLERRVEGVDHRRAPVPDPVRLVDLKLHKVVGGLLNSNYMKTNKK